MQTYKSRYPSIGASSKVNNPEFITSIALEISKKLGRDVSSQEQRYIIDFIRNLDSKLFEGEPVHVAKSKIIASILINMKKQDEKEIDVHEILKREIGVSSERPSISDYRFSIKEPRLPMISGFVDKPLVNATLGDIKKEVTPQSSIRHNYLVLDSRYRNVSFGPIQKFQWNYINNLSRAPGSVNSYGTVRDIISIRVLPIRIPYITQADNNFDRISMNIEELSPQGFVAHEDRRFHFLFSSVVDVNWIDLYAPDFNDGYYHFDDPVTKLDAFTITFGSPMEVLTFDADRANYVMAYGALFTTIITDQPHNLSTGDIVYFDDFTTQTPDFDSKKIAEINNASGHHITFINLTTFTIPVNTLGVGAIPLDKKVSVYFGSKRIIIPLEITYYAPE